MTAPSQLRLLTLNIGEIRDAAIYRLEKGWTLHFVLGPSLADKKVRIFVNHPTDPKAGPNRSAYHELKWENLSAQRSDVYDNFAEVRLIMAGSFNYYFTINKSDKMEDANGRGYFLVDPILRTGKMDDRLPLDCIRCQSILPKSLGTLDEWKERLVVSKESGYNMIHFTPVQELGLSNSSYCLKDQLKLNPSFSPKEGKKYTMKDLEELVDFMKNEWEVLSLTDLVFNHTANESPWIQDHPECSYNMINSPHLKPAYLLDRILWHFSLEVGDGKWESHGVPASITCDDHLQHARRLLLQQVLPKHRIHEYFQVHIDDTTYRLRAAVLGGVRGDDRPDADLAIIADPSHRRLKSTVDIALAIKKYYSSQPGHISRDERIITACNSLRQKLVELNRAAESAIAGHLECAVNNFTANGRWRFIDPHGPKIPKVSEKEPIMWNYFTLPKEKMTVEKEEEMMNSMKGAFCMAHNGWVMADDPLRNFAAPGSNIYLRRELIPWGDNVKLRYGDCPEDCPFLWDFMAKYVKETARIFHGIRLDNCHSTPINVAEYMLDEARKVRPDLYVIAELFTNSEYADNTFINRLGLNSLIREGLNAWNAHELGRLVHRFGGSPVGSFMQPPARPLMPSMSHAMFLDQTHDNESPIMKRCAYDLLPSSALIAMTCSATGSNRGYDELVAHYIDVVKEKRVYKSWSADPSKTGPGQVDIKTGLIAAKKAINKLHHELGRAGFDQIFVDQMSDNVVAVTRHNPTSHQSIVLVAHTAFSHPNKMDGSGNPPIIVPGIVEEIIFEAKMTHIDKGAPYKADPKFINGLSDYTVTVKEHLKLGDSSMVQLKEVAPSDSQKLNFVNFPPGSVIAFRVSLGTLIRQNLLQVRQLLAQFGYRMRTFSARNLEEIKGGEIELAIARLSLNDLNRILFRCEGEEKDDGKDTGMYVIPNYGGMTYCGLQGMLSILSKIRAANDLGHPLCENLRAGDWLLHYTAHRLIVHESTREVGKWLRMAFSHLSHAPRSLIPCYFDALVTGVYGIAEEVCWAKMSEFVKNGSTFVRALAWGSVQLCSYVKTAKLPRLSPGLIPPLPPTITDDNTKELACITMAAGLPHFASGLFRNWGRDTFLALRGLLLITGRFDDARLILLGYGGCLRHGLIPNLLGEGTHARFNCRDAVWFWMQCIKDYCVMKPDGYTILKDKVARLYPTDDAPVTTNVDQLLEDVMQEALQKHADGVRFRERNAGFNLDSQMKDEGFFNQVGVDWNTGFVFGGNEHNCGTWMDKMGSSEKAGNKGVPATPRDGTAVELIGLSVSVISWLGEMFNEKKYSFDGVRKPVAENTVRIITYKQWAKMILDNFENAFWISRTKAPDEANSHLINRRGIYKDTHGSKKAPWTDFQLRPNFPIAIALAPELVNPERAWFALQMVEDNLLGPLGMKTLDPSDWAYNGYYNNDDDSSNYNLAKGFNYHQGPEWIWPLGFFLRAKLKMAGLLEQKHQGIFYETVNFVKHTLSTHREHIFNSDWRSLPELTNKDGAFCHHSCAAQAWSTGCLLEVLYDMEQLCAKNFATV